MLIPGAGDAAETLLSSPFPGGCEVSSALLTDGLVVHTDQQADKYLDVFHVLIYSLTQ